MENMSYSSNDTVVYYDSLHSAVEDINNGTTVLGVEDCPKVMVVYKEDSRPVVQLMEDVTEFTVIEVSKNLVLDLGGKCLRFEDPGHLSFKENTDCAILGKTEGSVIQKSVVSTVDPGYLVSTFGTKLSIHGGYYSIEGAVSTGMVCIRADKTCLELEMVDCRTSAVNKANEEQAAAYNVLSLSDRTNIRKCNFLAEAAGAAAALSSKNRIFMDDCAVNITSRVYQSNAIMIRSGNASISNTTIHVRGQTVANGIYQAKGYLYMDRNTICASSVRKGATCVYNLSTTSVISNCGLYTFSDDDCACGVYNYNGLVDIDNSRLYAESNASAFAVSGHLYGDNDIVLITTLRDCALRAVSHSGGATCVDAHCGSYIVDNCEIKAITNSQDFSNAYGIHVDPGARLDVINTRVEADARNNGVDDSLISVGIVNEGIAIVENVTASGTHSGVQNCNEGQLYVIGGEFDCYNLGGVHLAHGPNGNAFINGATIRGGGQATAFWNEKNSERDSVLAHKKMGALCVGRCSGGSTYVDGCVIDDSKTNAPIVILGDSGEENNTLNISNTTLSNVGAKKVRVDGDTLRLNIGTGCNVTAAALRYTDSEGTEQDYVQQGRAAFTNGFYHRVSPYCYCTEQDMELLAAAQGNE